MASCVSTSRPEKQIAKADHQTGTFRNFQTATQRQSKHARVGVGEDEHARIAVFMRLPSNDSEG